METQCMTLKDYYADRIIEFIKKEDPQAYNFLRQDLRQTPIQIKNTILKHMEYNTCVCLWDKGEIIAVSTFNIIDDIADIIYAAVRKDYRFKRLLKRMIIEGMRRYPFVKKISFERYLKYKNDTIHSIDLDRLYGKKQLQEA